MFHELLKVVRTNRYIQIAFVYVIIMSGWWFSLNIRHISSGIETDIFTSTYGLLALWGGILGLRTALEWGGVKSAFGRALGFISFGLLAQFLGQVIYATYIYILGVGVPYPSLGDVGYFGSVIFYILGAGQLFRVVALRNRPLSLSERFLSIGLPLVLLCASYTIFLRGYDFSTSTGLATALDFGYPLGQAVYVSLALLVFFLSRSVLGGTMRQPMICLLFCLVFQYFCDYTFLYQVHHDSWRVAGINDYMYFASYFFMTLSLAFINQRLTQLRKA